MTMSEQIEKVLQEIPYDKIREESFVGLAEDGILRGVGEDIHYMMMDQNDQFQLRYMRYVKAKCWDIIYRRIRKVFGHGIKEWTQKRFFEEAMKEELESIDLGVAG